MGVFGFGEIIANLGQPAEHREVFTKDVKGLWPTKQDFQDAWPAVLRGTALGSILGVLPGGGALLASFAAYTMEKKLAGAERRTFGKGDIRGVAGPEAANNAGAQTSFIPMLTLGIPPNAVMALMVGAMTIKGIQPGPQVMTSNPQLFWGLIASMWVGNAMLVILNLPLIGIWIKLLTVPYRFLFPAITLFCCIGVYSLNNNNFDVYMTAIFAVVGYVFYKLSCEAGAAAARLHPRADDGREPAPRAAAVARRLEHVPDAAAVGRPADRGGADDRCRHAAADQQETRSGIQGRVSRARPARSPRLIGRWLPRPPR